MTQPLYSTPKGTNYGGYGRSPYPLYYIQKKESNVQKNDSFFVQLYKNKKYFKKSVMKLILDCLYI